MLISGHNLRIAFQYYNFVPDDECDPLTYHRLVEALKWAYAERTHMGDPYDPDISDYIESVRHWNLEFQIKVSLC